MPAGAPAMRGTRLRTGNIHAPAVVIQIQRGADHLHRCGPRAVVEFLAELAQRTGTLPEMLEALAEWRRLDPATVRGVVTAWCGGREFAPALSVVEDGCAEQSCRAGGEGLTP